MTIIYVHGINTIYHLVCPIVLKVKASLMPANFLTFSSPKFSNQPYYRPSFNFKGSPHGPGIAKFTRKLQIPGTTPYPSLFK